ncbi:putative DDE Tnp4 domain-containing protein [Phytophthora infestans]|uniref:Putative DDE Tnp4 domain-containing protein n=1 Tax=Phytophthora infestans TaxID=4787 RepID=A0A8S9TXY1_PHYIN|nr:putative DDE Tnp4 domain-containing protein [Phytophthora infestans]
MDIGEVLYHLERFLCMRASDDRDPVPSKDRRRLRCSCARDREDRRCFATTAYDRHSLICPSSSPRSDLNASQAPSFSKLTRRTCCGIRSKTRDKMVFDHRMVERLKQSSADAIFTKVGRRRNCFGFIDGTVRRICRPTRHQKQAIIMANGLIVSLCGPAKGLRHYGYMLRASEMAAEKENSPAVLTNAQTQFNLDLSKARIAVWLEWKYFTLPNNIKVLKAAVGLLSFVAAFLTNCLSCVRRRNKSSKYFWCSLSTHLCYLADISHGVVDEADYREG